MMEWIRVAILGTFGSLWEPLGTIAESRGPTLAILDDSGPPSGTKAPKLF